MTSLTEEQRICLAVWRKAAASPETFSLKLSSKSAAETIKRTLYRVIKPYRDGATYDAVLNEAAEQLIPKITEATPSGFQITFAPRQTLHELHEQLDVLGITAEDIMSEEELEAKKSLDRMTGASTSSTNPFYSRES